MKLLSVIPSYQCCKKTSSQSDMRRRAYPPLFHLFQRSIDNNTQEGKRSNPADRFLLVVENGIYHEKNIEEQFNKFNKLNVPKEELDVLAKAWELKYNMGKSLLNGLKELINYIESNNN